MRPDALPVLPLDAFAVLPSRHVAALFGTRLSGGERIGLARRGETLAYVAVRPGAEARLVLSQEALGAAAGARMVGPLGSVAAPGPEPLTTTLTAPEGLRSAWSLPDRCTVGLGLLALAARVETGDALALHVEPTAWQAAGRPDTARWLPGVDLAPPAVPVVDDRVHEVDGRVVTETAVRQARLHRRRIRLRPEQIVTPGARDLAREWDVFADR